MKDILEFQREHRWLSNFWPCLVVFNDLTFHCVECAYVAAKTLDKDLQKRISLMSAGEAKKFGRTLQIRSDWEDIKYDLMWHFVRQKFSDEDLAAKLKATGEANIVEGNYWGDTYWGVCKGKGQNNLGKIIMAVRAELRG